MLIRKVVLGSGDYEWFLFYKITITAIYFFNEKQKKEQEFL